MGLATSQARFLCITARKADCEYKSTELAQQKLEITNQLSDISATYANAMNATKLVWKNDLVENDYGLTYNLLMAPSAANDYNPYMVTTSSGAIVLNSEYAAAARAAGISKAGGIPSADSRDKFIAALVPNGIVTQDTANSITTTDYVYKKSNDGSLTLDTSAVDTSATTGNVGWNAGAGMGSTPLDKNSVDGMDKAALILSDAIGKKVLDLAQLTLGDGQISSVKYNATISDYDTKIKKAQQTLQLADKDNDPEDYTAKEKILTDLQKEKADFIKQYPKTDDDSNKVIDVDDSKFQMDENNIKDDGFTIISNGVIEKDSDTIKNMTIGDLLASNIVLMTQNGSADDMAKYAQKLMYTIAEAFGYNQAIGTGLNVDSTTNEALKYAMTMIQNVNLKAANAISVGSKTSDTSMTENSAFINANENNRIGTCSGKKVSYQAVSLSNLVSSFLTYFDNYMNGSDSGYVVGKSTDTSAFVTDDSSYKYFGQASTTVTSQKEKLADFYDQLYNNLCENGWREDASVQDNEYLENALKTGKYAMSSLHDDGYFYQTRYNETGYVVEETDSDAIARAEAEFTQKKAELTYKEDSIDMKSKKLDAEISSLSTEYETVKQLISKSIEKTFQMFQN